jgi:3-dehydroquinate synthase
VDMSCRLGWINETIKKRTLDILQQANLPIAPPDIMTVDKFKNTMSVRTLSLSLSS